MPETPHDWLMRKYRRLPQLDRELGEVRARLAAAASDAERARQRGRLDALRGELDHYERYGGDTR